MLLPFALGSRARQIARGRIASVHSREAPKVQVEKSEGEAAASTPKMRGDGEWWGAQSVGMFPSDSRHDGEVRVNETHSMVPANGDQGALVEVVPSHDGALVVAHDAPMAYHAHLDARARVNKEIAVQLGRRDQSFDDLNGDMPGTRVQGSGRAVGVEAKRRWMVHA